VRNIQIDIPKDTNHKKLLNGVCNNKPNIKDIGFTEPPKAMPDEFKVNDVVESYRNYYRGAKMKFAVWKNGYKPEWLIDILEKV